MLIRMAKAAAPGDPKTAALKLLARREHSRQELQRKLQQRGFAAEAIAAALNELESADWLSATRYAEAYVRSRIASGFGPLRIQAELSQRGLDQAQIQAALEQAEADWAELASRQYHKRFGETPITDMKERAKRQRYLAGRGFPQSIISDILSVTTT